MGLMDAKDYDPRPEKRRKRLVATCTLMTAIALAAWVAFRHWPEKHAVDSFFKEIEAGNLEQAYGRYTGDVHWQDHPADHQMYTFGQFRLDWGPSGSYGTITQHHVECVTDPPKKSYGPASGVIAVVTVNQRSEPVSLWVEKSSKSITISPLDCTRDCRQCQY